MAGVEERLLLYSLLAREMKNIRVFKKSSGEDESNEAGMQPPK